MAQRIFKFSGSQCDWTSTDDVLARQLLGGKGAGLVKMAKQQLPVPPGFTITTEVCNLYRKMNHPDAEAAALDGFMASLMDEVWDKLEWLKDQFGYTPLMSVRSGAPVSMPGMMDTILNVGLTDSTIDTWVGRIGARAAWDSYRRLIQMLGATAYGVPKEEFEALLTKQRFIAKVKTDAELDANDMMNLVVSYKEAFKAHTKEEFPQSVSDQMEAAIKAVFDSWMNERAVIYRQQNKIDDAMGTAVTVQSMVFGNMNENSGSGVLFTRNPLTGEKQIMAEYLANAQGEDVVAGVRTPDKLDLSPSKAIDWKWEKQLYDICQKLEMEYRDMVDIEFTVQDGKLFILQSRSGKRAPQAAFKIAVELVIEGVINRKTALSRLTLAQFKGVRRPSIDPKFKTAPQFTGLAASPGVVSGKPVFTSKQAVESTVPCILVTHETTPDDIAGMVKAKGILTQTGGATSHAAVVARAMDRPCVVGATMMQMSLMKQAKKVTIDGATGNVWLDVDVPVIDVSDAKEIRTVMKWCLKELGASEMTVVDMGDDRPHRIMAAHWWGSHEVLNAVLDGLVALPSRKNVEFDTRSPKDLTPAADAALEDSFGVDQSHELFKVTIEKALADRGDKLFDLTVYGSNASAMASVPGDYAAMVVLGR